MTTTDWQLKIVSRFKWLRKIPGWHRRETDFRAWYIGLLDRVKLGNDLDYQHALTVLRAPDQVSGYREVRYPKMDQARRDVEQLLSAPRRPSPTTTRAPELAEVG
jgi:indolepyruvate ferredoxin oxidoreductase